MSLCPPMVIDTVSAGKSKPSQYKPPPELEMTTSPSCTLILVVFLAKHQQHVASPFENPEDLQYQVVTLSQ